MPSSLIDLPEPAEEQKADQPEPADEEMVFGYPVSLLRANDIDPEMLQFLPEEIRVECLSNIEDQFAEWQQRRNQRSQ